MSTSLECHFWCQAIKSVCPSVTLLFDWACLSIWESSRFNRTSNFLGIVNSRSVTLRYLQTTKHPQLSCGGYRGCGRVFEQMMKSGHARRSTQIVSSLASAFINRGLIYQNSSLTSHQYVRLWGPSWSCYPSSIQSGLLWQQHGQARSSDRLSYPSSTYIRDGLP